MYGTFPHTFLPLENFSSNVIRSSGLSRSAMILTNNEEIYKKINSAVFPGLQGGPLMHVMAAKAVSFGEALDPSFEEYIKKVISNAKHLSEILVKRGFR